MTMRDLFDLSEPEEATATTTTLVLPAIARIRHERLGVKRVDVDSQEAARQVLSLDAGRVLGLAPRLRDRGWTLQAIEPRRVRAAGEFQW
jgi:hypothetical protein